MTETSTRPVVGFVGLGDQGGPIAQAIADSGYPLLAWARHTTSLQALTGFPHEVAGTPAELAAGSDIVALCLREDSDNLEVATDGGLLAAMKPDSILVNHGTGLPAESRKLAELAAPYGVSVIDAPVSGGHAVAVARQLTTIVGGPRNEVSRIMPILRTFSKEIVHMGPTGAGQYGKLFNNALMMLNQRSIAQVLDLAAGLDLPLAPLLDVLRSGSATSFAVQAFGGSVTPDNAHHLSELELIDMELFCGAVDNSAEQARDVVERAIAGARGLPALTATIDTATTTA